MQCEPAVRPAIRPREVSLVDASGLSDLNQVSPAVFVQVLVHVAGTDYWDALWASLPEAGVRQGLARMYRTPASRNLRAKTGTIEGVSALSGVVTSASGERLAFSILSNGLRSTSAAKRIEDRIGAILAAFRRPPPNASGADPSTPG